MHLREMDKFKKQDKMVKLTTFKNEEEYFEDNRLKWESSGLLDDVDEGIQVRMSIALELIGQRLLNEIFGEEKIPKTKNSNLILITTKKILQEAHSLLPEASFASNVFMSDELKEVYEKVMELLNLSPRRIKKSTQDKLSESVCREVLNSINKKA